MARYRPSIHGVLTGSIGDLTYTKNRYGAYVKTKPIPTNRNTPAQATQRGYFRDLVAAWKSNVTLVQADAWRHAAHLHKRSTWGMPYDLSGPNLFIAINTLRLKAGLVVLWEPTIFDGAPGARIPTVGVNAITGKLDITDWDENNADLAFFFYAGAAVAQTINYRPTAFVFSIGAEKDTAWPVVIDVTYPAGAGSLYRVFWGFKLFHTGGAVASMVESNSDGTIV